MEKAADMVGANQADGTESRQYLGLRDGIAARISSGDLMPGDKLPSERQLQGEFGLARGTIREALFLLEAEGAIFRRDRSGWYVSPPPVVYDPTRWEGFMSYVEAQGRVPTTQTISTETIPADPLLSDIFSRPIGAPLHHIRRLRSVDGRAVLVEKLVVDAAITPGLLDFDLNTSLTAILKRNFGITVARNQVSMQPCALTGDEAVDLRQKSGLPGLALQRVSYDGHGRVVEFDHEYWRHDAVQINVDLRVR